MMNLWIVLTLALIISAGCTTPTAMVTPREKADAFSASAFNTGIAQEMEFDEKSGFYYKFEYDRENIYILLATSDLALQRKIVYSGLAVWIDRSGDRNKAQGFKFPAAGTVPASLIPGELARGPDAINSVLGRAVDIQLTGIYGSSERIVNRRDSQIKIEAFMKHDLLMYKALVPFGVLKHRFDPVQDGSKMSIGLETGFINGPERERSPQEFDGRGPVGGMQQPGARANRPPGQVPERTIDQSAGMRAERNSLYRPTRLWVELLFSI